MDFLMNWVIMGLGIAGFVVLGWVVNRPQCRLRDGMAAASTLLFCALFLRNVDDKLVASGLSWSAVGSLDPAVAEDVFGGALFMTAFIVGALVIGAAWILPDAARLMDAVETNKRDI